MALSWIGVIRVCVLLVYVSSSPLSESCTYMCDDCPETLFYTRVNDSCLRTSIPVRRHHFLLGPVSCWTGDFAKTIHDDATCFTFAKSVHSTDNASDSFLDVVLEKDPAWSRGILRHVFDARFQWDPGEGEWGCSITARIPGLPHAKTQVCLASITWRDKVLPSVGGIGIGIVLASISVFCAHRSLEGDEARKEFLSGAKLLVARSRIEADGSKRWVLLFRTTQVIANAWFPSVMCIFIHQTITFPCYIMLYLLPAFCAAGVELFRQPIYAITPPDASLFGIDHEQPNQWLHFLISAIRPYTFLFVVGVIGQAEDLMTDPNSRNGSYFWNSAGFFRMRLIRGPGPVVLDFILIVTALGVIAHTFMVFRLLCLSRREESRITLLQRNELAEEIETAAGELCQEVARISIEWNEEDGIEDELEAREEAFKAAKSKHETWWGLVILIMLAIVDFFFYLYKIFIFMGGSQYFLAFIILASLSEAIFTLVFTGAMLPWRMWNALRRTFRSGVQTADFMTWVHWDDSTLGVPYLMVTTIYALPLQDLSSWPLAIMAIVFTCTGTRAMAMFIMDSVDFDMLDVQRRKHRCRIPGTDAYVSFGHRERAEKAQKTGMSDSDDDEDSD